MSSIVCPLFSLALAHPNHKLIDGSKPFTALDVHLYSEQIQDYLAAYPSQSVIAIKPSCPIFFTAALIACARLKLILFPVSPRLPKLEILNRLKETKTAHYFETSFLFEKKELSLKSYQLDLLLPFTYLLTSGSSSKPKICVHSLKNHFVSAKTSNTHLNYVHGDRWLLSLPLFHVSGLSLIFRTLLAKATLVTVENSLSEEINKGHLTHLSLIPTQLQRLITNESLKKLKCILLGGAPISSSLIEKTKSLPLYPTYGLTEMSSQVATFCPRQKKIILLQDRELKITSQQEVCVRGKTLFMGYLEKGEIKSSLDTEGWFHTKDLGSYLGDHFIYLGRKGNLFISGGENIQPEEIEAILLQYPSIQEAIVVPKPDSEFGERPIAFLKTSQKINIDALELYLSKHLPKYKWPIEYLPLQYEGLKPSRKKLKDFSDS